MSIYSRRRDDGQAIAMAFAAHADASVIDGLGRPRRRFARSCRRSMPRCKRRRSVYTTSIKSPSPPILMPVAEFRPALSRSSFMSSPQMRRGKRPPSVFPDKRFFH